MQNSGPLGSLRNPPLKRFPLIDDQQQFGQGSNEEAVEQESDECEDIADDPNQLPRFQESCEHIMECYGGGPFNTSTHEIDYLQVARPQ